MLRDRGVNVCLAKCLNSVLNVKALVGAFNQDKALVGAFSVIVQLHRLIDLQHYQIRLSGELAIATEEVMSPVTTPSWSWRQDADVIMGQGESSLMLC